MEVGGLHCSSCSTATEKALSALTGVSRATVSLALQQAEVEYDPALVSEVWFPFSSTAMLASPPLTYSVVQAFWQLQLLTNSYGPVLQGYRL